MRDQRAGEGKGRGEREEEELVLGGGGEGREDEWERAVEEEEKEKEEPPQTHAPSWRTRAAGTREASFALLAHGSNVKGRGMESGSGEGRIERGSTQHTHPTPQRRHTHTREGLQRAPFASLGNVSHIAAHTARVSVGFCLS